ncbi:MAG TPA: carboxypeptidase regulatory-like domain-containing protein [Longimicrobiaceae bacterium]|nr:carboxypeptidase regulatory-like domain-containing protein [Longimicrobiaceae bacterium]
MSNYRGMLKFAALAALPLALNACGGGDDTGGAAAGGGAPAAAVEIQDPGSISGTITFYGTAPTNPTIDMRAEAACLEKHEGTPVQESVVVNDNGTLRNVFVYVKEGLTQSYPATGATPEIDQDGCVYEPRVLGVQPGQNLTIRNSDPVLHNVNARPTTNRGFNISQPQAGMTSERSFASPEIMIPVQCDVHGWMHAYIGVVDHPYFAVSGDDGSFRIENLPPGNYVLETWHEVYGTQTTPVTVPPNGNVEVDVGYREAMAATAIVPLGQPIDLYEHHGDHAGEPATD